MTQALWKLEQNFFKNNPDEVFLNPLEGRAETNPYRWIAQLLPTLVNTQNKF